MPLSGVTCSQRGMTSLNHFFTLLRHAPQGAVFNPWFQRDTHHDASAQAPTIRARQLRAYLQERSSARILLLAEALGYQGGHFTGLAMTSERLLLGHLRSKGLTPDMVFSIPPQRTSRAQLKEQGFTEPTCTIVWGTLATLGIDPRAVILWNAFPWHPHKADKGLLSNRTPSETEILQGRPVLDALTAHAPSARILGVGQKAAGLLAGMGIQAPTLRHPANGGAGQFRKQLGELFGTGSFPEKKSIDNAPPGKKTEESLLPGTP